MLRIFLDSNNAASSPIHLPLEERPRSASPRPAADTSFDLRVSFLKNAIHKKTQEKLLKCKKGLTFENQLRLNIIGELHAQACDLSDINAKLNLFESQVKGKNENTHSDDNIPTNDYLFMLKIQECREIVAQEKELVDVLTQLDVVHNQLPQVKGFLKQPSQDPFGIYEQDSAKLRSAFVKYLAVKNIFANSGFPEIKERAAKVDAFNAAATLHNQQVMQLNSVLDDTYHLITKLNARYLIEQPLSTIPVDSFTFTDSIVNFATDSQALMQQATALEQLATMPREQPNLYADLQQKAQELVAARQELVNTEQAFNQRFDQQYAAALNHAVMRVIDEFLDELYASEIALIKQHQAMLLLPALKMQNELAQSFSDELSELTATITGVNESKRLSYRLNEKMQKLQEQKSTARDCCRKRQQDIRMDAQFNAERVLIPTQNDRNLIASISDVRELYTDTQVAACVADLATTKSTCQAIISNLIKTNKAAQLYEKVTAVTEKKPDHLPEPLKVALRDTIIKQWVDADIVDDTITESDQAVALKKYDEFYEQAIVEHYKVIFKEINDQCLGLNSLHLKRHQAFLDETYFSLRMLQATTMDSLKSQARSVYLDILNRYKALDQAEALCEEYKAHLFKQARFYSLFGSLRKNPATKLHSVQDMLNCIAALNVTGGVNSADVVTNLRGIIKRDKSTLKEHRDRPEIRFLNRLSHILTFGIKLGLELLFFNYYTFNKSRGEQFVDALKQLPPLRKNRGPAAPAA